MFIELTDHLRCPADHDESYLVLLPDRMEGRSVRDGPPGLPGVRPDLSARLTGVAGSRRRSSDATGDRPLLDARGARPRSWVSAGPEDIWCWWDVPALAGAQVAELNPGVALVAVNPPTGDRGRAAASACSAAGALPLKSRSMRGVVLGAPYGGDPRWVAEAVRVVLPGLRVVGEGAVPAVRGSTSWRRRAGLGGDTAPLKRAAGHASAYSASIAARWCCSTTRRLHLQRRRQLARLDGEILGQQQQLLRHLELGQVPQRRPHLPLHLLPHLRIVAAAARGRRRAVPCAPPSPSAASSWAPPA